MEVFQHYKDICVQDWTCRNQVGYLYGSVCDLKFFPIAAATFGPICFSGSLEED
jgi:hypothetical protein